MTSNWKLWSFSTNCDFKSHVFQFDLVAAGPAGHGSGRWHPGQACCDRRGFAVLRRVLENFWREIWCFNRDMDFERKTWSRFEDEDLKYSSSINGLVEGIVGTVYRKPRSLRSLPSNRWLFCRFSLQTGVWGTGVVPSAYRKLPQEPYKPWWM